MSEYTRDDAMRDLTTLLVQPDGEDGLAAHDRVVGFIDRLLFQLKETNRGMYFSLAERDKAEVELSRMRHERACDT